MLDRKYLRENADEARARLALRGEGFTELIDEFLVNDGERRGIQTELDELRAQKNTVSKQIGEFMKAGERDKAEEQKALSSKIGNSISELEDKSRAAEARDIELLLSMPNLTHESIPVGGEENAEIVKTEGEPKQFRFEPKDHVQLCDELQLVNFAAGARVGGSGFPFMCGNGALLQRALINLMLDTHVNKHGYTELRPPYIVHPRCPEGTGQLPKFSADMYHVNIEGEPPHEDAPGQPHYYLIPTAEVPVCNYYREQLLEAPTLPIKVCAYSPCWRVEGGSYGKEARGLTRLHQFEKVELVRLADPAHSYDDLEEITAEAEAILKVLGLAFRRKVLPTGDMAFASAKTYDLEVYCPGEQAWREISSASNTTDYQARRANIRFRREQGAKPEFPHMLNASGLALPRLVIAVVETYQNEDGSVTVPDALKPYLPGMDKFTVPTDSVPFV